MSAVICTVVGVLDDGPQALTPAAQEAIAAADLLIGVQRTLDQFGDLAPGAEQRDLTRATKEVAGWAQAEAGQGRNVVVLASGDPLCHGIGERLSATLGPEKCRVVPAPSLVQVACARLGWPVAEVSIASVHGREAADWCAASATPEHPLSAVLRALRRARRVAVYTTPAHGADWLARQLRAVGFEDEELTLTVASRLGRDDESIVGPLSLAEAATWQGANPHVALIDRSRIADGTLFGNAEEAFAQRQPHRGLITKREARAVALASLELTPASRVWDIGTGSGAVAIEAARLCPDGHVWAIERHPEDLAIAEANRRRWRVGNLTLVGGTAPEGLEHWQDPDAVFIGGSGGALEVLIDRVVGRLRPGGRLVINLVTLENLQRATTRLDAAARAGLIRWQAVQLQAQRTQELAGMRSFRAENPVWICTAHKSGEAS